MLLPFRCHLPVSGLPQPTGQAFVQSHTFPTDSRRKVFVYWNDDKGQVIGRYIFSFYSDSGFYPVRPVRLERSGKAFLHWPAELLASSSDTTGRAFGKPNRTLVPAPMVFRHKTLHLSSALQGKEGKFYWMKGQATLTGVRIPGLLDRIISIKYWLLN